MAPPKTNMYPITTPQPTFTSTIRNQDRESLSSHRRSGSQFSSADEGNEQLGEGLKPMFPDAKPETIPIYDRFANKSSLEGIHDGLGVWGRRTYKSYDIESGSTSRSNGGALSRQTTCVSDNASFIPLPALQKRGTEFYGGGIWKKFKIKCNRWMGSTSPGRRAVLVLEITLAGMVVGIIMGLAFGVSENMKMMNDRSGSSWASGYISNGHLLG